jgi:hypothetical protein
MDKTTTRHWFDISLMVHLGAIQMICDTLGGGVYESVTKYHMRGGEVGKNVT